MIVSAKNNGHIGYSSGNEMRHSMRQDDLEAMASGPRTRRAKRGQELTSGRWCATSAGKSPVIGSIVGRVRLQGGITPLKSTPRRFKMCQDEVRCLRLRVSLWRHYHRHLMPLHGR